MAGGESKLGRKGLAPVANVILFDQAVDHITYWIHANPGSAARYLWRAAVWKTDKSPTRPSPTTTKRSASIPAMLRYTSAAATPGATRRNTTRPSATTARPSASIRGTRSPTTAAAMDDKDDAVGCAIRSIRAGAIACLPARPSGWTSGHNPSPMGSSVAASDLPHARHRDGRQAVAQATKACDLSHWKAADHLDTLAAAHAELGDFESAVTWESRAIDLEASRKEEFVSRLKLYQQRKPFRETGDRAISVLVRLVAGFFTHRPLPVRHRGRYHTSSRRSASAVSVLESSCNRLSQTI